jgi:hypothetical protein
VTPNLRQTFYYPPDSKAHEAEDGSMNPIHYDEAKPDK